eukprot:GHRQ01036711.1.p1 GENE.GHRQ01036711.1~~GHRQ01036711.1.p1  ORF type:complete len:101 (-),score=11.79 GHRQ01036711.1:490-759(-)
MKVSSLTPCPANALVTLQAFAAVGTMEGAWFVATGAPRSFSEQQLIDCAWQQGPHGCDGGDYRPGFRYVNCTMLTAQQESLVSCPLLLR